MPRRLGPMVAVPGEQNEFAPAHSMMGVASKTTPLEEEEEEEALTCTVEKQMK